MCRKPQNLTRNALTRVPRIIPAMRAVFLILMIALLPLRGWLGDAMAMQMVTGHTGTIEIVATHAYPIRAEADFSLNSQASTLPCHDAALDTAHPADPGLSATLLATTASGDTPAHGDCAQCTTCQVCHSVALSPGANRLPLLTLPTQAVHSGQTRFVSVPRAPQHKPPIS